MLNTLTALRAPEFHCRMYPSKVGFSESANLPMTGMVQASPGRCRFLYLYTDCSRARSARTIASVVYNHVAPSEVGENNDEMGMLYNGEGVEEGIVAD